MNHLDPLSLYAHCAQDPPATVRLLRAIHGGTPRHLGEDFSGTAQVSLHWLRTDPAARAVAIDVDPATLSRARHPRLTTRVGNVLDAPLAPRCDIVWVGNFSIGEIHDRVLLVKYLRRVRGRLKSGGVLVCDLYDGPGAWRRSVSTRRLAPWPGVQVLYRWRQIAADPRTRMVHNRIDFHVSRNGQVTRLNSAFVYRWRLWSPRSLARAMRDAGFAATEFYPARLDALDGTGRGYVEPRRIGEFKGDHVLLVCGRR